MCTLGQPLASPVPAARHQLPRDVPGEDGGGSEQNHTLQEGAAPACRHHAQQPHHPACTAGAAGQQDCTQGQEIAGREKRQPAGQAQHCLPARRGCEPSPGSSQEERLRHGGLQVLNAAALLLLPTAFPARCAMGPGRKAASPKPLLPDDSIRMDGDYGKEEPSTGDAWPADLSAECSALPGRSCKDSRDVELPSGPQLAASPSPRAASAPHQRWAPLPGLPAGHVAVALADIAAQEPAHPARAFGAAGGDLDAAAVQGGSQVALGAAGRRAPPADVPLADLDPASQADPCKSTRLERNPSVPTSLFPTVGFWNSIPSHPMLLTEAGGLGRPAAVGLAGAGRVPQQQEAGPAAVAHHGAHPPVIAIHH